KDHPAREVELAVVPVDEHAEVVEVRLTGVHHGFPDRAFLQFAVAADGIRVETWRAPPRDGKALRDTEALAHRARRDADAGKNRARMAVQDARIRPRIAQDGSIEVAELGVDRGHGRDGVALAQHEEILAAARRIDDVDVDEPAVVERDERDGGREGAAGVQALVDSIAALFEVERADVGGLDGQQLEDALAQHVRGGGSRRLKRQAAFGAGGRRGRHVGTSLGARRRPGGCHVIEYRLYATLRRGGP